MRYKAWLWQSNGNWTATVKNHNFEFVAQYNSPMLQLLRNELENRYGKWTLCHIYHTTESPTWATHVEIWKI